MYNKYPWNTTEEIEGLEINIPAAGYVFNRLTGEMEKPGVFKRSPRTKDQYWERTPLPKDWDERHARELSTGVIDPTLETFRREEWYRRLNGFWFYNNGNPTYVTGLHYFFLNWWYIGNTPSGYPDYRDRDRRFFYMLQYIMEDPNCVGLLYITRRREGKTKKGGVFLYEPSSRMQLINAGIQSKTEQDAIRVCFQEAILQPYLQLPDFFKPTFDTSAGKKPKKGLVFTQPSTRGKAALKDAGAELNSAIEVRSSGTYAFDGSRLDFYLGDEIFKTKDLDIEERHRVVKYCLTDSKGQFRGKALYTSTVEEFEGAIENYRRFWDESNQAERNANGRTKTGLYRLFVPAYESLSYDIYGMEDVEANKTFFLNERAALAGNPEALQSEIRKNPFTLIEAFRVSKGQAAYDITRINDQIAEVASFQDDMIISGDLVWTDGPDSQVKFVEMVNGPFQLLRNQNGYEPDVARSGVRKVSGVWVPNNPHINVAGVDPFDHVSTVDNRRSNGAAFLFRKFDSMNPEKTGLFVLSYLAREQHPKLFYEAMIKLCVWSGCTMLYEDNKPGLRHYFEDRGYLPCLMHLPDRKEPGIPSSFKTKQDLVETTKAYVLDSCHKIYFMRLLEDLRDFIPTETKAFDAAMAAGWCLVADKSFAFSRSNAGDGRRKLNLGKIFR